MEEFPVRSGGPPSEFPPEFANGSQADNDSRPLEERLVDKKKWNVRLRAYEELMDRLDSSDCSEFTGSFKAMLNDSHAAAQEKAVEVFAKFVEKNPAGAARVAGDAASVIVEKCLSGRASTKSKALVALEALVEFDCGQFVSDELVAGFTHKQPKVIAASLSAFAVLLTSFGVKALPVKAALKSFAGAFDSSDAAVRNEAKNVATALYQWIGPAVKPSLEKLRPAQEKELETAFEAITVQKVPPKLTRSARAAAAMAPASSGASKKETTAAAFDPLEFVDAVDVLAKMPKDFCDFQLSDAKWTEKKEQLDAVTALFGAPKIVIGDFTEVVKTLKRLLSDPMVVLGISSAKALMNLANGGGKDFAPYAKLMCPVMLEKLAQKNKLLVDASAACLDAMAARCFQVHEVLEDIFVALQSKVPPARTAALVWLKRAVQAKPVTAKALKPLSEAVVKLSDDSDPNVREAAIQFLAALYKPLPDAQVVSLTTGMDPKKATRVRELMGGTAAEAAPDATKKAPSQPTQATAKSTTAAKESTVATAKVSAATTSKAAAPGKSATAKSTKEKKSAGEEEDLTSTMTPEDAERILSESFDDATRSALASSNWKDRLTAMEGLAQRLSEGSVNLEGAMPEAIVRVLAKTPGFKESNVQVFGKMLTTFGTIASNAPKLPKRAAFLLLEPIVDKIADAKLKGVAMECLMSVCEAVTPAFVLTHITPIVGKQKSPKVIADAVAAIDAILTDFGAVGTSAKLLLDLCKAQLDNSNPLVKSATIRLLVTMRRLIGPAVRDGLNDVKQQLLVTIDDEFSKIPSVAIQPKRAVREAPGTATSTSSGSSGAESLFGRTDISSAVSAKVKELGDANWKVRQDALSAIEKAIVDANRCISPSVSDLIAAMKHRVGDSNKNLIMQALGLVSLIASSIGPAFERNIKAIVPAILANVHDNKKNVRDAMVTCLDAIATVVGFERIVPYLPAALATDNGAARKELLDLISKCFSSLPSSVDLTPLVKPLIDSLTYRTADVRSAAESLIAPIAKRTGMDSLRKEARGLKPALLQAVSAILERVDSELVVEEAPAPPPPKAEARPQKDTLEIKPVAAEVRRDAAPVVRAGDPKPDADKENVRPPGARRERETPRETSPLAANGAVLLSNDQKSARLKKEKVRRWILDGAVTAHLSETLQEVMSSGCISDALATKLFHSDVKKQLEGLTDVANMVSSQSSAVLDNSDVLFKYLSLRLFETSTTPALASRCLDLVSSLLSLLSSKKYQLLDAEAAVLVPALIERLSSSLEPHRKSAKAAITSLRAVYAPSKLFVALVDTACIARTAKSRAEVADEIGLLVSRFGNETCPVEKAVAPLAKWVAEKDPQLRAASFALFVTCHEQHPVDTVAALSSFPDSIRSVFEDKLKTRKEAPPSPILQRPATAEAKERPTTPARAASSELAGLFLSAQGDLFRSIEGGDVEDQVLAYKKLCRDINVTVAELRHVADAAMAVLVRRFSALFAADGADVDEQRTRLCKHNVFTMSQVHSFPPP